jgi:hypothetical protein
MNFEQVLGEHFGAIQKIAERVRTQDNAITADPIFVVQQRVRMYGMDPDVDDVFVWLDSCNDNIEIEEEEAAKLEETYQKTLKIPGEYCRTGYKDIWEFVQPFFTRKAAEAYIEVMRHRLTDPRVYVESGYRNREWQTIRALLMLIAADEKTTPGDVTYLETSFVSDPPDPFCRIKTEFNSVADELATVKDELKKLQEQMAGLVITHSYMRPPEATVRTTWHLDIYPTLQRCKLFYVKGRGLLLNVQIEGTGDITSEIKIGDIIRWEEKLFEVRGIERSFHWVGYVLRPQEQGEVKV